jgi:hypothetical protein
MSQGTSAAGLSGDAGQPKSVYLVSYPKIVFLWPAWLTALIAGCYMLFAGGNGEAGAPATGASIMGWAFLIVLSINLVVLSFDFPRATSLIIFFVVVALVLGLFLVAKSVPDLLPMLGKWASAIHPAANAHFYFFFFAVLGLIYCGVLLNARLDYWEVRPNELLHHHGVLSDLERFAAPNLRIDKEIGDVFEYLLMGSGRLILHPSNEPRAIVLENVFRISTKEKAITRMLGALQVQVRTEGA